MEIKKNNAATLLRGEEVIGFIDLGDVQEGISPRSRIFFFAGDVYDVETALGYMIRNWDKRHVKGDNKIILEALVDYYKHSDYHSGYLEQEFKHDEIFNCLDEIELKG
jgi:hypothetical protein